MGLGGTPRWKTGLRGSVMVYLVAAAGTAFDEVIGYLASSDMAAASVAGRHLSGWSGSAVEFLCFAGHEAPRRLSCCWG